MFPQSTPQISIPQMKKYRAFSPAYFMPASPQIPQQWMPPPPLPPQGVTAESYLTDPRLSAAQHEDTQLYNASAGLPLDTTRGSAENFRILGSGNKSYPAMLTIKETLLLWTRISTILFFLAALVSSIHLWIWAQSSNYYFQHWQIVVIVWVPHVVYVSAICALLMYWFVMCRWYMAQIRQLAVPEKVTLPRHKREIIPLFFPLINWWGLPQVLTELLIMVRRYPQPARRISYRVYLITMRRLRIWSISWSLLWLMTLAEILASCLVQRADSIALNDEFRIIWLLCIGLHLCYTYRILKVMTLLTEVVTGVNQRMEENSSSSNMGISQSLDIMTAV